MHIVCVLCNRVLFAVLYTCSAGLVCCLFFLFLHMYNLRSCCDAVRSFAV